MLTRRRVAVFVAMVMVMSVSGWSQASEITPVKLLGGGTDQWYASVNANWLGWSTNAAGSPGHYDAYVRSLVGGVLTGPSFKVNAATTTGLAPDLQSDADTVAYQQINRAGRQSTIYTVDVGTQPFARVAPPGLNSPDWEYLPAISQSWILFGREAGRHGGIFLYNRTTHAVTTLTNPPIAPNGYSRVTPDDVTETYATWTRCGTTCNVYYYDIASHTTAQVPNPHRIFYYASSVSDATGNIYFVRSGNGCGVAVKIFRWHIGDPGAYTTVSSLPTGYDGYPRTSTFNDGTHDTVSFQRQKCAGRYNSDLYQVPSADTA